MSESKVNLDLGLRDYEVLVWTLLDSYIATLKWSKTNHKGQILDAKMGLVDDGTESFSFTIPMYLYMQDGDSMIKVENPIWYMTLNDGTGDVIIKNMHKIKVIINKTMGTNEEKKDAGEHVYEFLITKVTDSHEEDKPECKVECEGLAFHELGKQGYKTELSSEVLYNRLTKFSEGKTWYDNNHVGHLEEPKETIDYWMNDVGIENYYYKNIITDGILKNVTARESSELSKLVPTKWYYRIEMNYDSYSLLPNGLPRDTHRLYEDAYTSSWDLDLVPQAVSEVYEKCRLVDAKESNVYNLTLTIAENFNIFCRYEYIHDMNYCITGRQIIFYNNFIKDTEDFVELTYPHTSMQISREYDATDITTKMYVRPEEDDSTLTGLISIIDTEANPTKEDYIMNFDYFHKIGTISDELYDAIEPFEKAMRKFNDGDNNLITNIENALAGNGTTLTILSRRVVGDKTFIYTPGSNGAEGTWATEDGITPDEDEQDEINFYVPNPTSDRVFSYNGKTYTYTRGGWIDQAGKALEGLISLLEKLIAKEERKVEVKASLTTAENSVTLAQERIDDANKHIDITALQSSITFVNPLQYIVLTNSKDNSKYISLSTNHREINFDSIHMYRKFVSGRETEAEAFPALDTITLPPGNTFTINWNSTSAKNAKKLYRKIYNIVHPEALLHITLGRALQIILEFADNLNLPTLSVTFPSHKSNDIAAQDDAKTFYENINILNDLVGWVLYAIGLASFGIKHSENFKRYIMEEIAFNGKIYEIGTLVKDGDDYKIRASNWNIMRMVRSAWRLSIAEGLDRSKDISISVSGDNATVTAVPKSWATDHLYHATNEPKGLRVGLRASGIISWSYNDNTATSLLSLWDSYYKTTYPNFYLFLSEFGVETGANEIKHFTGKYNSDHSLILLIDLPNLGNKNRVYLTYTFDPNTYYRKIAAMWEQRRELSQTLVNLYANELDELEQTIEMLENYIRIKLKDKYDAIRAFERMMGPALRESYWLPEDYHNYGDVYTATLGTNSFIYEKDEDNILDKLICAKFIWDNDLFSEENKCYYDYTVNQYHRYYDCLDLLAIYTNLDQAGKAALIAHINDLAFVFYNDSFDKYNSSYTSSEDQQLKVHIDNGVISWYYALTYDMGSAGIYNGEIPVQRKESNMKSYIMGSTMNCGFVKDSLTNNKVIPILIITGLDELPDSTMSFIRLEDTYTGNESLLTDGAQIHPGALPQLGYFDGSTFVRISKVSPSYWILGRHITNLSRYETVYPRIKINSMQLKTANTVLTCVSRNSEGVLDEDNILKTPDHYYTFNRRTNYYITVKPEVLFKTLGSGARQINVVTDIAFAGVNDNSSLTPYLNGSKLMKYTIDEENNLVNMIEPTSSLSISATSIKTNGIINEIKLKQQLLRAYDTIYPFNITYTISNGGTYIYLDAIDVMKENSVPKVAYTVLPNLKDRPSLFLYDSIGQIVMINDYELKLDNVFGYISEVLLDLDHPWEDEVTVKDYKNKFEDLFSMITAETEEMKKNKGFITNLTTGNITPILSSAIYDDLSWMYSSAFADIFAQYLASNFDGREVVEHELNSIFSDAKLILEGTNDALLNASLTNETNADLFASLMGNINERIVPKIFNITWDDPNIVPENEIMPDFKLGDLCITPDGTRYLASANKEDEVSKPWKPFYDGSISNIKGATVEWDADAGTIDLLGENLINIKSGNMLSIAADAEVNITGNKEVNITGTTINICSGLITLIDDQGKEIDVDLDCGGVNIIASAYDIDNSRGTISGVYIKPTYIEMISSEIKMMAGLLADGSFAIASNEEEQEEEEIIPAGSLVWISGEHGIFIGTNNDAGIRLYSGTYKYADADGYSTTLLNESLFGKDDIDLHEGTSVKILPSYILFTTITNGEGTVVEMSPTSLILGAGTSENNISNTIGLSSTGVLITKDMIGLAVADENPTTHAVTITAALLDAEHGFTIGSGINFSASTNNLIDGSFVRINSKEIRIGSDANLYLNTNNIKLQSDENYNTRFAIGYELNRLLDSSNLHVDLGNLDTDNFETYAYNDSKVHNGLVDPSVLLLVNDHGCFVSGMVYANELWIQKGNSYFQFTGSEINVNSNNLIINPSPNDGDYYFYVGEDITNNPSSYIGYTSNGLTVIGNITANTLTVGDITADKYMSYTNSLLSVRGDITTNTITMNLAIDLGTTTLCSFNYGGYNRGYIAATASTSQYADIYQGFSILSANFNGSSGSRITFGTANLDLFASSGINISSDVHFDKKVKFDNNVYFYDNACFYYTNSSNYTGKIKFRPVIKDVTVTNHKVTAITIELRAAVLVTSLPSGVSFSDSEIGKNHWFILGTYTYPASTPSGGGLSPSSSDSDTEPTPTIIPTYGGCFVAGTLIVMSNYTTKNIEDIKIGDYVIAYNDEEKQFESRLVTKSYIHHNTPRVLLITLSNGLVLGITPGHPILTTEGWKSRDIENSWFEHNTIATWLEIGDEIIGYYGNVVVTNIQEMTIPDHYDTYNIEVEKCHTFTVEGLVVHNLKVASS